MKNFSYADQDYDLWALLDQTRDAIFKARQKELSKYGISPIQAAVFFAIEAVGKATPAEISRSLLREPHSVSELLNRMEKEGKVRKVKDLPRKNQVRVELTEKGREAYSLSRKQGCIHNIMSSLSPIDATLSREYRHLRSHLETLRDEALKELGRLEE